VRRLVALFFLGAAIAAAQPSAKDDVLKLTDQLDAAIQAGDWAQAAQISRALKRAAEDARNQSMAVQGSELADSILAWLPPDAQTLVVAQQPFTVVERDERKLPSALQMAQSYVLGPLGAAEKENLFRALAGRTVRLAAIGARAFGEEPEEAPAPNSPAPLGMIPYQGCGVYAFTEPVGQSIFGRPPEDSIMGYRVWVSKGTQNDTKDRETYLVALIKPDLMLSCNHREFFQEMVARMALARQPRALPANLSEWKYVDRTAPLWGISHYTEKQREMVAGLSGPGANIEATGLTVAFGLGGDVTKARVISKSNPWQALADSPDFRGAAKSREAASGVWELTVEGKPEAAGMAAFALMAYLGFVVLI
jgi:hypothetical protein